MSSQIQMGKGPDIYLFCWFIEKLCLRSLKLWLIKRVRQWEIISFQSSTNVQNYCKQKKNENWACVRLDMDGYNAVLSLPVKQTV